MARLLFMLVVVLSLAAASCHGYNAPSTTATVTCTTTSASATSSSSASCTSSASGITVTISPATASLNVEEAAPFLGQVSGGTNNVVTWGVNNTPGGNPTVGVVDSNGNYHAPATVPSPATVSLTATSIEDQTVSATAMVTILAPPVVTISPTSWTLPSGTANTKTFTGTVTGAPTTNLDWEVNGILGGNATFGTVSAGGTYTAPLTPPLGSTVTVTAASHDFPLSTANAMVTISGFSTSSFNGSFAFSMSGTNASGSFFRAGAFSADGAGNLNGGLEEIHDAAGVTAAPIFFTGSYTMGADGRGTLTFNDGQTPSSFRFVLVNSTELQIIGFESTSTATGQANAQDLAAFRNSGLTGTYVFDVAGLDASSKHLSQIGEFTADGMGAITGGSLDINDGGALSQLQIVNTAASPSFYSISSNGRGTATISTAGGQTFHFSFYIVSRGSVKLVGTDPADSVAGVATQQVPNATFDKTSLNGNYAFLLSGSGPGGPITTAGSFSAAGDGLLTAGVVDENGNGSGPSNSALSNGSYTVSPTGRGTATFTANGRNYALVFYFGMLGHAVLQETDSAIVSDGYFAQQQSGPFSASSVQGTYAINAAGLAGASTEVLLGELATDGAGGVPSGAIDINTSGAPGTLTTDESVSGTYTTPASNGRGTLTLNPSTDKRNFAIYVVSPTQVIVIGIDAVRRGAGAMLRQF